MTQTNSNTFKIGDTQYSYQDNPEKSEEKPTEEEIKKKFINRILDYTCTVLQLNKTALLEHQSSKKGGDGKIAEGKRMVWYLWTRAEIEGLIAESTLSQKGLMFQQSHCNVLYHLRIIDNHMSTSNQYKFKVEYIWNLIAA